MKYLKIGPYEIGAFAIIVCATLLRIILAALGWPLLDSDESTMGLMAMHIASRGEHPIFIYGQGYMGSAEAYLGAMMFHLFGVSTFTLRLGVILLFVLFLVSMYLLTSLLYTKKWALVTLALLSFGSNAILVRELVAVGGDPETLLSGSIVLLLASWLALTYSQEPSTRLRQQRLVAYGGWGLVAGFGLWSHLLVVPFVLMGGLILLLFCWRDLRTWAPWCLLLGLVIGAFPLIIYNLKAPPGEDSLSIFWKVHRVAGITRPPLRVLLPHEIKGALLISLPTATGANPLCSVSDVHLLRIGSLHGIKCTLVHTGWALGAITLWTIAVLLTIGMLWQLWRRSPARRWSPEERQSFIRHFARLTLLATAAITMVLYILSPNPALFPVGTSRYLIGFLITIPAILWPLSSGSSTIKPLIVRLTKTTVALRLAPAIVTLRRGTLLLIGAVLLTGTISTFTGFPAAQGIDLQDQHQGVFDIQAIDQHLDIPTTQALSQRQYALIHDLLRLGITHIYSDYWTCDRIIFQSQEHIICSALKEHLEPGHDRYLPYGAIVKADPHAAYVFPVDSLQAIAMAQKVASSRKHYYRFVFDGYVVYQPEPATAHVG